MFNKILFEARNYFELDTGITITIPGQDCVEFFNFGATREQNIKKEFLLSHLCLLYQFVSYFREQANLLLRKSELYCLETNILPDLKNDQSNHATSKFLNRATNLQLVYCHGSSRIALSQRQSDSFYLYMKGYSHKAIAKELNVLQRTITTHLNILKTKLKIEKITYNVASCMKLIDLNNNLIVDEDPLFLSFKLPISTEYQNFVEETKINRLFLKQGFLGGNIYLTKSEANVLYHLSHGLKTKEIAEKLGISPRTIYDHIEHARRKMRCFSRLELAKKFLNTTSPELNAVLFNFQR